MKDTVVYDEKTGIRLYYVWNDLTGWSFRVTGYESREEQRAAMMIAYTNFPEIPAHLKEAIDKHNKEILDFNKAVITNPNYDAD